MDGLALHAHACSERWLDRKTRAEGVAWGRAQATEQTLLALLLASAAAALVAKPSLAGDRASRRVLSPATALLRAQQALPSEFAAAYLAVKAGSQTLRAARALAVPAMATAALGCAVPLQPRRRGPRVPCPHLTPRAQRRAGAAHAGRRPRPHAQQLRPQVLRGCAGCKRRAAVKHSLRAGA